jgi:hypothetical protein
MIPGLSAQFIEKGKEKEGQAKIKRYMTIMDSMTEKGELTRDSITRLGMYSETYLSLVVYLQSSTTRTQS